MQLRVTLLRAICCSAYLEWTGSNTDLGSMAGWITYLAAPFAAKIAPPRSAMCEQVDGGLLMSATQETFRLDNPVHVAVARDIDAALAPINALPWPPDANDSRG